MDLEHFKRVKKEVTKKRVAEVVAALEKFAVAWPLSVMCPDFQYVVGEEMAHHGEHVTLGTDVGLYDDFESAAQNYLYAYISRNWRMERGKDIETFENRRCK